MPVAVTRSEQLRRAEKRHGHTEFAMRKWKRCGCR
jgi:hypothetical protein